mmetsp:Transcript_40277/g.86452  ORF Transcript_40277/g.86452 Transcript_40277/m.86452 type:complete len:230 (-) Transcript_40277:283-972(-)
MAIIAAAVTVVAVMVVVAAAVPVPVPVPVPVLVLVLALGPLHLDGMIGVQADLVLVVQNADSILSCLLFFVIDESGDAAILRMGRQDMNSVHLPVRLEYMYHFLLSAIGRKASYKEFITVWIAASASIPSFGRVVVSASIEVDIAHADAVVVAVVAASVVLVAVAWAILPVLAAAIRVPTQNGRAVGGYRGASLPSPRHLDRMFCIMADLVLPIEHCDRIFGRLFFSIE